jgi:hypothetical protein
MHDGPDGRRARWPWLLPPAVALAALSAAAWAGTNAVATRPVPLGVFLRGRVQLRKAAAAVHNVAGVLPGAGELAKEYLVVGAHYDHLGYGYFGSRSRSHRPEIHPGADDNASGTAAKINPQGAIQVLRLVEKVLERLWSDEERIAYVPPGKGSGGAFLGISFDGDYEGAGCKVGSVLEGAPAAKGGIEDGDVVVKWEGREVADAAALIVLVRHSQPGSSVKLTIRRGGKTLDVKVKLGGR